MFDGCNHCAEGAGDTVLAPGRRVEGFTEQAGGAQDFRAVKFVDETNSTERRTTAVQIENVFFWIHHQDFAVRVFGLGRAGIAHLTLGAQFTRGAVGGTSNEVLHDLEVGSIQNIEVIGGGNEE